MTTEREIFDRIKQGLRSAASDCDLIARQPISGPIYERMRRSLRDVEDTCRQAAYQREDARWLQFGLKMEEAHQRARRWLHRPSVASKKLFTKLAEVLRKLYSDIERLETMRTNRMGLILPKPLAGPLRDRPVQVMLPQARMTAGGIILP